MHVMKYVVCSLSKRQGRRFILEISGWETVTFAKEQTEKLFFYHLTYFSAFLLF